MQRQTWFGEMKRRSRRAPRHAAMRCGAVLLMVAALALPRMAAAAELGLPMQIAGLLAAINDKAAQITALQDTVNALQTAVTNQSAQLAALQAKTQFVSVSGVPAGVQRF